MSQQQQASSLNNCYSKEIGKIHSLEKVTILSSV